MQAPATFVQSERIRKLAQRSRELGRATNSVGEHACLIDIGPFPPLDQLSSRVNGYGRLDLYPIDLYRQSKAAGELSDEEAREYLSEMFLKLRGHFLKKHPPDGYLTP